MMGINMDTPELHDLFNAILSLKNEQECADFLADIMTIPELKAISQRLQIANHLYYHEDTYETISHKFGVSAVTISRVKNALHYGTGGYETILRRLKENSHT